MSRGFTWEYRLREVPGVFSQGQTREELEENIRDAYRLRASRRAHASKAPHAGRVKRRGFIREPDPLPL